MKKLIGCLLFLCLMSRALAENDVMNTVTQNTVSLNTMTSSSSVGIAKDWNLTENEWTVYQELMQGSARYYYSQLTPPEVLGHYANNAADLQHFAEVYAKLEHDRVERELRFAKAFHEAVLRIYDGEPIIKSFDYTPYTPIPRKYYK